METKPAHVLDEPSFQGDPVTPRWIRDVLRFLPIRAQFLLSGNVRDRQLWAVEPGRHVPMALIPYLGEVLSLRGYEAFLVFNPADGFSVVAPRGGVAEASRGFFASRHGLKFDETGRCRCSLDRAMEVMGSVAGERESLVAVFMDFASRLTVRVDALTEREHEFFTRALMLSQAAGPHVSPRQREAHFNTIFWVCDQENDLPGWLAVGNPRLRTVLIPKPDHVQRRALVSAIAASVPGFKECQPEERLDAEDLFVDQTESMLLVDLVAISQLARRERLGFREIGEAVRRFKLGVTEDPWRRIDRRKIRQGAEFIHRRVKGQHQAVTKALDIMKRAVTGLSGAQASRIGGRPRGVLFLAGPTGVGKTELAKTITELLFGDERAYIRFDMSEFSAEHADQRLIGAPPGYVGYDAGGELTNAIREKPFAVVLFDEIEKAHPRILDKFLQLLDDGVLTSGRGDRVYFSEAVIVFTSNLGIYRVDAEGHRVPNVTPEEPYETVESKVRDEIGQYFKTQLNRPEILNRIGENIVVFDFIRPDVAGQIYRRMVAGILQRLEEHQRIRVTLAPEVELALMARCTADLSQGGRGIGNRLEAWLINPLARALFDNDVPAGSVLTVEGVGDAEGVPELRLGVVVPVPGTEDEAGA
jgi:energy-coupling factor transporter ATP-binding protein EcfA2